MSTHLKKLIMKSMRLPPLSQSKMAKSFPLTVLQRKRRKNERGGRKIVKTAPNLNKHYDWVKLTRLTNRVLCYTSKLNGVMLCSIGSKIFYQLVSLTNSDLFILKLRFFVNLNFLRYM